MSKSLKKSFLNSYKFSLTLIASMAIGSIIGIFFKKDTIIFKPLGDIFLNLLFMVVVPLVFFSLSCAVAQMKDIVRLGKIMGWMLGVFIATGIVASLIMVVGVQWYPPAQGIQVALPAGFHPDQVKVSEQIVKALTHKGGLLADVLTTGVIRCGDKVVVSHPIGEDAVISSK